MQNLVPILQKMRKDSNEGDLNKYSTDLITQGLKEKLIVITACSREGYNMRLTSKGRRVVDDYNFLHTRDRQY